MKIHLLCCFWHISATEVYVGNSIFDRHYTDSSAKGTIVMVTSQPISAHGELTSWHLHIDDNFLSPNFLSLRVWRPTFRTGHYILVGTNYASNLREGNQVVDIKKSSRIMVLAGDVIGFSWEETNPISYDLSSNCEGTSTWFLRDQAEHLYTGGDYVFEKKDTDTSCRIYSLFATAKVRCRYF